MIDNKPAEKMCAALLGLAVGDALGVPVEFQSRRTLELRPVTGMRGYGSHNQPPGTFSDDSSLAFCLAESLCQGDDLQDLARRFIQWRQKGYWTAHGEFFDIGGTTQNAISRLMKGMQPGTAGDLEEWQNGNGSLMRILPLAWRLKDIDDATERYRMVREVSSVTHGHFRSVFSCFIYLEFVLRLMAGDNKFEAHGHICGFIPAFAAEKDFHDHEVALFDAVLDPELVNYGDPDISGSGYVLHSLEAALWCILRNDNYRDTVLAAVNLGEDTDTTACIAGGPAAMIYGEEGIPENWLEKLVRVEDIRDLGRRLTAS